MNRLETYIDAALERATAEMTAAQPGTRHNTVNRASFSIGRLVGAGALSYSDAERVLLAAAPLGQDYSEHRAQREITVALQDGLKNPVRLPDGIEDDAPRHKRSTMPPPAERATEPAQERPCLPPRDVLKFWNTCLPVTKDEGVAAYLSGRKLDPYAIACLDMARALPDGTKVPRWAAFGKRSWTKTGHQLISLLWSLDLKPLNVIARCVIENDTPKGLSAQGHARAGLCMLDYPAGKLIRRGQWPPSWPGAHRPRLVVAEGEIDALAWATTPSGQRDGQPSDVRGTIGIVGGSWSPAWAKALPGSLDVTVATDHDKAGEEYAQRIQTSLEMAGHRPTRWHPHGR